MKVALLQIKNNRKIYGAIWNAYASGLKKYGIEFHSRHYGNEDVLITCGDTWDKVKNDFNFRKQKNLPYITNYIGHFNKEKILSIDDRERERDNPSPKTMIFCNYIDFENKCHKYIEKEKLDYQHTLPRVCCFHFKHRYMTNNNGSYILIFEQWRPEYHSEIKTRKQWFAWLEKTIEEIRKQTNEHIIIQRHPNKKFFQKDSDGEPPLKGFFKNTTISQNGDLNKIIKDSRVVVTLSSKISVQCLLMGKTVFSWEKYSPAEKLFNQNIKDINDPTLYDIQSWFNSIANSYWSLSEIADGTYIDHLMKNLMV